MAEKTDFIQMEHEVLDFWEKEGMQKKLMEKNKNGKPFRFLDGPITANNPMGVHHAWGRSIKDITIRYKGMTGRSCHYRNGFDGQGLWVEVEVEKELGFVGKKDIEAYGMDKFTRKCVERVNKFSGIITEQSIGRLFAAGILPGIMLAVLIMDQDRREYCSPVSRQFRCPYQHNLKQAVIQFDIFARQSFDAAY